MSLWDDFVEAYPPFPDKAMPSILPYIKNLVNEQEMRLVVAMKGTKDCPINVEQIADSMHMNYEAATELLEKCVRRGIVIKRIEEGKTLYLITEFPRRLFNFVAFDKGWNNFPRHIRRILSEWMHRVYYYDRYYPIAEKLKRGEPVSEWLPDTKTGVQIETKRLKMGEPRSGLAPQDILLLDEVLEMVDAAEDFAVATCNCRTLDKNCDFPTETCLRFNDEAKREVELGRARRLTRDEMKELIINIDKKGLIHKGNGSWKTTGLDHFCSCCACCCYPFRVAIELGLKGIWPKSYYIAVFDSEKCSYCGICMRRCQFGAWEHDGTTVEINGKTKKNIVYDPEKCWGCGLCANTCPSDAITMKSLEESVVPWRVR